MAACSFQGLLLSPRLNQVPCLWDILGPLHVTVPWPPLTSLHAILKRIKKYPEVNNCCVVTAIRSEQFPKQPKSPSLLNFWTMLRHSICCHMFWPRDWIECQTEWDSICNAVIHRTDIILAHLKQLQELSLRDTWRGKERSSCPEPGAGWLGTLVLTNRSSPNTKEVSYASIAKKGTRGLCTFYIPCLRARADPLHEGLTWGSSSLPVAVKCWHTPTAVRRLSSTPAFIWIPRRWISSKKQ